MVGRWLLTAQLWTRKHTAGCGEDVAVQKCRAVLMSAGSFWQCLSPGLNWRWLSSEAHRIRRYGNLLAEYGVRLCTAVDAGDLPYADAANARQELRR